MWNCAFAFLCALSLFLTSCSAPAQKDEEKKEDSKEGEASGEITYRDFPFDFVSPESSEELMKMEFPESLDLREYGLVTPVKLQNPFGTCWGFAAVAAAETSLLGSGIAQIKAEGINAYKDAVEEGFPIVPAKAVIQEAKASGTAIDVTVADQSESGITGYKVRCRAEGSEEWKEVIIPASETHAQIKDLKKGRAYEVRVCGYVDTSAEAESMFAIETEYSGEESDPQTVTIN